MKIRGRAIRRIYKNPTQPCLRNGRAVIASRLRRSNPEMIKR